MSNELASQVIILCFSMWLRFVFFLMALTFLSAIIWHMHRWDEILQIRNCLLLLCDIGAHQLRGSIKLEFVFCRLFQVISCLLQVVSRLAVGRFRSFLAPCRSFQVVPCFIKYDFLVDNFLKAETARCRNLCNLLHLYFSLSKSGRTREESTFL